MQRMEAELRSHRTALSAEFCARSGLAQSTVWMRAAQDARFLDRIQGGGGFTIKTYDKLLEWFSANWPPGAQWPDIVERPYVDGAAA